MTEERRSPIIQTAIIGLVGTFLTTCGGISGALISGAATIYQVQQQAQQVALPAAGGDEIFKIDTGSIFITRQEASSLDPKDFYVDLEQAFILHRPLPGWDKMEEITVEEQLAEENVTCLSVCDQPVYRIRYGEPVQVESDRNSLVNGKLIPENILELSEQLYGPPPWKLPFYNQVIVNIFEKSEVQALGIHTLPDMVLLNTRFSAGVVNRIVSPADSHYAIVQLSSSFDEIRINDQPATMTVDYWFLVSETDTAYYTIEIRYTPLSGQSIQTWDDLQLYIDQFRVIQ